MPATLLEAALPAAFDLADRHFGHAHTAASGAEITEALAEILYRDWYCAVGEKPRAHGEIRDLTELLRAAHAGTMKWQDGWQVHNVSSRGRIAVSRAKERRVVHVIDCIRTGGTGAEIAPGDRLRVVMRRDSESMNPGDWVTFSEAWHANKSPRLRIYWNINPAGAPHLVRALTEAIGDDVAYFIKCPRKPEEYDRRDAVVLYLPRQRFADVAAAIARTAASLADCLCPPVPTLTREIAPGVGLAEDPGPADQSFGTSRCSLVARGIGQCIASGRRDRSLWTRAVLDCFSTAGVPADRPWLETHDSPEYRLP